MNEHQGIELKIMDYIVTVDINGVDGNDVDFSVTAISENPDAAITQELDMPTEDDIREEVRDYADMVGIL